MQPSQALLTSHEAEYTVVAGPRAGFVALTTALDPALRGGGILTVVYCSVQRYVPVDGAGTATVVAAPGLISSVSGTACELHEGMVDSCQPAAPCTCTPNTVQLTLEATT